MKTKHRLGRFRKNQVQASNCSLPVKSYRQHLIVSAMMCNNMYEVLPTKGAPEPWCLGVLVGSSHMAWTPATWHGHPRDWPYSVSSPSQSSDWYRMAHSARVKKKCFLYKWNCWHKLSGTAQSVRSTKKLLSGSACLTGIDQGWVLPLLLFWGRVSLCSSGKFFSWGYPYCKTWLLEIFLWLM